MPDKDFYNQQQKAVEQMKQMNARSTNPKPKPSPPRPAPQKQSQSFMGLNLPFDLLKESDTALILGLLLLLFSENADKRLLFALVYILL